MYVPSVYTWESSEKLKENLSQQALVTALIGGCFVSGLFSLDPERIAFTDLNNPINFTQRFLCLCAWTGGLSLISTSLGVCLCIDIVRFVEDGSNDENRKEKLNRWLHLYWPFLYLCSVSFTSALLIAVVSLLYLGYYLVDEAFARSLPYYSCGITYFFLILGVQCYMFYNANTDNYELDPVKRKLGAKKRGKTLAIIFGVFFIVCFVIFVVRTSSTETFRVYSVLLHIKTLNF